MDAAEFCSTAMAYLRAADAEQEHGADAPVMMDLNNGLVTQYLVDQGDDFALVLNRDLQEAGLTLPELHALAVANLWRGAEVHVRVQQYSAVCAVFLDGNFEASLLLADPLWDDVLTEYVTHDYVAAVPAPDVLAFCDSASADGINALRGVVQRVIETGDELITDSLYVRRNGQWERLCDA